MAHVGHLQHPIVAHDLIVTSRPHRYRRRRYAAYGLAPYEPMRCIAKHATKWEWTGSSTLRMGKQLRQSKGWHFGACRGVLS
jgi:hypothetical protein